MGASNPLQAFGSLVFASIGKYAQTGAKKEPKCQILYLKYHISILCSS